MANIGDFLRAAGGALDRTGRTNERNAEYYASIKKEQQALAEKEAAHAEEVKTLTTLAPIIDQAPEGEINTEKALVLAERYAKAGVDIPGRLQGVVQSKKKNDQFQAINENIVSRIPEENRDLFAPENYSDPSKLREDAVKFLNLEKANDFEKVDTGTEILFVQKGDPTQVQARFPKGKLASENTKSTVQAFFPDGKEASLLQDEQGNFFDVEGNKVDVPKDTRIVGGKLEGGKADFTTKTKSTIEGGILDLDTKMQRLDEINRFVDNGDIDKYLNLFERGKQFAFSALDKTFPELLSAEQKESIVDFNDFKATLANNLNATVKELSGAAVTTSESERLSKELPTEELSPQQFMAFLWLASAGYVINWYGDSMDGTLARYRKIERPKFGYYIDHMVDAFVEFIIILSLGFSSLVHFEVAAIGLIGYLLLSIHTYLRTYVDDIFKISFGKLGPTEVRVLIILINTVVFFSGNPQFAIPGNLTLSLYDLLMIIISLLIYGHLINAVLRTSLELSRLGE